MVENKYKDVDYVRWSNYKGLAAKQDDRMYKTGVFRLENKPTNAMLYSVKEIFDEFEITMESV